MLAMSSVETKGASEQWKQSKCKCEYIAIDDPCKICRDRNLPCTAADKVWGQTRQSWLKQSSVEEVSSNENEVSKDLPRQPHTPDAIMLRPFDGILLQFYLTTIDISLRYRVYALTAGHDRIAHPDWSCESLGHDVFQRFGPTLSTMAVRYAILLFSLRKLGHINHCDRQHLVTMEYQDHFYRAMRKAIDMQAYTDVLYASYFTCLRELLLTDHQQIGFRWDEFITHLRGFVSAIKIAAPTSTHAELISTKTLFANILHWTVMFSRRADVPDAWLKGFIRHFEVAHFALKSAHHTNDCEQHLDMFTGALLHQKCGYAISTYHWQPPQNDCECRTGDILKKWGLDSNF